jgi:hypothetical protein
MRRAKPYTSKLVFTVGEVAAGGYVRGVLLEKDGYHDPEDRVDDPDLAWPIPAGTEITLYGSCATGQGVWNNEYAPNATHFAGRVDVGRGITLSRMNGDERMIFCSFHQIQEFTVASLGVSATLFDTSPEIYRPYYNDVHE